MRTVDEIQDTIQAGRGRRLKIIHPARRLRIGVMTGQLDQWLEQNNADHLKITELLLRCEYETAAELLQNHLERSKKITFDTLLKCGL